MNCTDFWDRRKLVRAFSLEELRRAVQAHGGKVSWSDDDTPMVLCNHKYAGPVDVKVKEIRICSDGSMWLDAVTDDDPDIEVGWSDIEPDYISSITEAVPETDDVHDVSLPYQI